MYTEITKRKAREMYNEGKVVCLMASNLNPHNFWSKPLPVYNECGKSFEQLCNEFSYYNCTRETGERIRFYVKEEEAK